MLIRDHAIALDERDPLKGRRAEFLLPPGVIYLDGNSLGPVHRSVSDRVQRVMQDEWGRGLIRSWNAAGWIDLPQRVGARIARLIGAGPHEVIVTDSTSINIFKLLAAALDLVPGRRVILSERDGFPTDLYMAQGLSDLTGRAELRLADSLDNGLNNDVGVVLLTEVDFRTGRRHDQAEVTRRVHESGALIVWDLAHSAGAYPVDVHASCADFAVGCGYKYLNGGPGAPSFLYVREDLQSGVKQPLSGWMGHARPFDFRPTYEPAPGIGRFACGTPPVLSLAALDAALDAFEGVDLKAVRAKSVSLMATFMGRVDREANELGLELASPREHECRGSQVSYRHAEAYAVMQALIARGVIGDFRDPDLLRFGFTPLYLSHAEAYDAAEQLCSILRTRAHDQPEFRRRARVT